MRSAGRSAHSTVVPSTRAPAPRAARAAGSRQGMSDRYAAFPSLRFERPEPGILRIVLDAPGLNAVGPRMHRDLADVWLAVDRDAETRVAILCGAGKAFSAGGSFELIDEMVRDYALRTRVLSEAG